MASGRARLARPRPSAGAGALGRARNARADGGDRVFRRAPSAGLLGPRQPELAARCAGRPRRGAGVLDPLPRRQPGQARRHPQGRRRAHGPAGRQPGAARGPAPATFFLLRRALEAGTRPEAIVVDFKPSVLVGSPRYNLRYWQEIVSPRECLELARTSGGGSLPTSIVLGRLLPTFRSRLEVRDALLAALRGEVPPMRAINRVCRRNWRVNDGANVGARNPAFTGEVGPDEHRTLLSHLWYCHRANAAHVRRLLDLTAARGIRVYWLLPPLSPQLQARREQSGAEAGYLRFIQSMHARYRHLTIVDGRHASYDHTLFVDATHLNEPGGQHSEHRPGRPARSRPGRLGAWPALGEPARLSSPACHRPARGCRAIEAGTLDLPGGPHLPTPKGWARLSLRSSAPERDASDRANRGPKSLSIA